MIFIAVGTQKFQFDRLLKKIDELVANGSIRDELFAQTGHSNYQPQHYPFQPFLKGEEFSDYIEKAEVVILHSGDGSILDALRRKKRLVVIPRQAKYREHIDDHQVEIAEAFSSRGLIETCWDLDLLADSIRVARVRTFREYAGNSDLEYLLERFIVGQHISRGDLFL